MFRITLILSILLVIALIVIGVFVGRSFGSSESSNSAAISTKRELSIHTTVREVLPAAEFISLHYRYTSVIKDASSKEMFGVNIPGTGKKLLAVIDGTVKLGVDCKTIQIDTTRTDTLFIKLSPIKILSHELHPETAEVYDQKNGIFNKYRASDHFALEAKQKDKMDLDIRANRDIILAARNATEYAFKSFLHSLPVLDTVPVVFRW